MIVTQQKNVPWRWVYVAVTPWLAVMFIEQCSGAVLTLTLRKFIENPAFITAILSINIIFNVLIGAPCNYVSDRIWTRFGRRRPFIIASALLVALFFALTPLVGSFGLLLAVVIIWLAFQDVGQTNMPLQHEIVPAHQRGRAGALFSVIVQLTIIFTFVVVLGRFHEISFFDGFVLTGEHGAYWCGSLFLLSSALLIGSFVKELPVKQEGSKEKMSPLGFVKGVFADKELLPIILLAFAQTFLMSHFAGVGTLLFVEQWGYSAQEMGTNIFVGALITIGVSSCVGFVADKYDRIKLYIFGLAGALVMKISYYVLVQFILPDQRPSLLMIIITGQMIAAFGMITSVVGQPLMFDFIPRSKMGTATAGISIVRSTTRWITLNGAGLWVLLYSKIFCAEGEYDYFSYYLYMIVLNLVGMGIIFYFRHLVKTGVLKRCGREGVEEASEQEQTGDTHDEK